MPFKLRLKKTRHYNVLSRNVLVLSVELIDKTTLECTLSSDSTGLECLHNVCQRLGLQQPEFFGLRYMSKRPYPKVRWVELDRPLKKQLDKYAQAPNLYLAVQYYIHDVGLLQDDITRSQYFLQVKQDVLEGKLRSNYELAVLLASYSLQAEFGDQQPERHTPEYLKDFRLFPNQAVSESEMGSLLEAVVWQYSSLNGLAQALAETYYILEAQRLSGYGQETFIARDEKGSEVYLGASLLGILVQPASGELQTFYRWNDITNLINHKRNFGIECSRSDETVQFTFEEPDAAKYVWKMCVKQHTFYKGNQELLEGVNGMIDNTRTLAIPDLQTSVMASANKIIHYSGQDVLKNENRLQDSRTMAASLPHLEIPFQPKTNDSTLGTTMDSSTIHNNHDSFGLLSQSLYSLNASRFSFKKANNTQTPCAHPESNIPNPAELKDNLGLHMTVYMANKNSSTRNVEKGSILPEYRLTPDYETAVLQKYGHNTQVQTILYSSQPEISSHLITDHNLTDTKGNLLSVPVGDQYNFNNDQPSQLSRTNAVFQASNLHNTYSTPELTKSNETNDLEEKKYVDYHFIHGFKPPPPYPYNKPSSTSTPDLASASKDEEIMNETSLKKRSPLLTASLGCLGSPELSRTYENLTDLSDAVESLRNELTKPSETSFLHSFAPNYSTDGLDSIYQLSNGHVAIGQNLNLSSTVSRGPKDSNQEPIYQNVETLLSVDESRERTKSAPEIDILQLSLLSGDRVTHNSNLPYNHSWVNHYVPETKIVPDSACSQNSNFTNRAEEIITRSDSNKRSDKAINNIIPPDILNESRLEASNDPKFLELECKMASLDIVQEYESVPRIKTNCDFSSASKPENLTRNRYKDILPYEENRVKLIPSKDNKTGYVNASHITISIGDKQRFYICAQGPMASTVGHFWQCVWETDVRLIVMLTSIMGDTQTSKSFPYWPQTDNTSVECDQFRIYRKHSTEIGCHITSRLQLVHIGQRKSRSIWHLQFTDWADHGCPQDTQAFINFLQELSTLRRVTFGEIDGIGNNRNTPVLVHCSAGVGRSGVTLICDILLEAADHNHPVDPLKILRHLRLQRMAIVQSFNQYKFVYKVLLAYMQKARLI